MGRSCHIIWYDEIDSTNSEAARRLGELDNMSVIAARCQTASPADAAAQGEYRENRRERDGHDALDREKICNSILHFCLLYKNRTA